MSTYYRRDDWVTDAQGNAISGAGVYVCSQPATTTSIPPSPLVQLYADSAGATPITQPVLTDGYGHAEYYVAAGTYTVVYYSSGIQQVNLADQLIGGAGVTFPVTIAEGGTNATTAAQALINLGAAGRGANSDITSLSALSPVSQTAVNITGTGNQIAIAVTDGVHNSSWNADGLLTIGGITTGGSIVCGTLQASSSVACGQLINATPGAQITLQQAGGGEMALQILGTGTSETSLLGFGATGFTYPTQTTVGAAGSASSLPSAPSFYLQCYVAGNAGVAAGVYVCPFYKQS